MRELPAALILDANHHIATLAWKHDIALRRMRDDVDYTPSTGTLHTDGPSAQAFMVARVAYVPVIHTALDYMIALHEIGHLVRNRPNTHEAVDEGLAWAWAAMHALPEVHKRVTAQQWRWIGAAYTEYLKNAD